MAVSDESCLVTSIVFDVLDDVHPDLLVPFWNLVSNPPIFEGVVLVDLTKFQNLSIAPLGVSILLVQTHGLSVIAWDLVPVLVDGSTSEGFELGLIQQTQCLLLVLDIRLKGLPSIQLKYSSPCFSP